MRALKVTLAELFDGRSQLLIKYFMMAPGQAAQCIGCSLEVDHIEGVLVHLHNHDVTYAAVTRAPIEEIKTVRKRMGWCFRWVSSHNSDCNYDFNVSFTPEQISGFRLFAGRRSLRTAPIRTPDLDFHAQCTLGRTNFCTLCGLKSLRHHGRRPLGC